MRWAQPVWLLIPLRSSFDVRFRVGSTQENGKQEKNVAEAENGGLGAPYTKANG